MLDYVMEIWPHVAGILTAIITLVASGHAILNKRDTRSAVGWVGVIWLVPVLGALLYIILGVNRIKRRARALRSDRGYYESVSDMNEVYAEHGDSFFGDSFYASLSHLIGTIVQRPLIVGNRITPLINGENAYPSMIQAIDSAEHSINLSTYIFDNDKTGMMFVDALEHAVTRKVEVRVLIDDFGVRYSFPPVTHALRRSGVVVARFLPTFIPWRVFFFNLRNHRKLLIIDGKVGFTGGMNIREGHLMEGKSRHHVQDIHFKVEGPLVSHLQDVFAEDWSFSTREILDGQRFFPALEPKGHVIARGISDGPDEDFEKLQWAIHGALSCARSSVRIITPYFLPDSALIKTLNLTAMRGVEIDILVPEKSNLPFVAWASTDLFWQLLEHGCRIWLAPPPFDHSKLMVVDNAWVLFGSGNWDTRSFRLNFEFNVECYDHNLALEMEDIFNQKINDARLVTYDEVTDRRIFIKLRDGVARLFSPYL